MGSYDGLVLSVVGVVRSFRDAGGASVGGDGVADGEGVSGVHDDVGQGAQLHGDGWRGQGVRAREPRRAAAAASSYRT